KEGDGFHFYRSPFIEQWQTDRKKTESKDGAAVTRSKGPPLGGEPVPHPSASPKALRLGDLDVLGAELFLDPPETLREWADLLLESRQIIFQGPPGTGKTYIARKLAVAVTGDMDKVELVQFHPSYAYEDFVEGYRPTSVGGFALQPGPVKRLASKAAERPDDRFVLLIDEI